MLQFPHARRAPASRTYLLSFHILMTLRELTPMESHSCGKTPGGGGGVSGMDNFLRNVGVDKRARRVWHLSIRRVTPLFAERYILSGIRIIETLQRAIEFEQGRRSRRTALWATFLLATASSTQRT